MTQPSSEEDKNQVYLEKRLEEEENERQIILQQKLLNQIVLEKIHSSYTIQGTLSILVKSEVIKSHLSAPAPVGHCPTRVRAEVGNFYSEN